MIAVQPRRVGYGARLLLFSERLQGIFVRPRGAPAAPQLQQVVRGGDQAKLRAAGCEAAPLEAVGAADDLCLREDRLD
jgi:hypothetical protein